MNEQDRLWAIILAMGERTRLAVLTMQLYGELLPRQFAVLTGEQPPLQTSIEQLLPLVPTARIVVVVALAHEARARDQRARYPGIRIVAQPANRGAGPGVLLPLAHVLADDPGARAVIAPSDHDFDDSSLAAATSAAAFRRSFDSSRRRPRCSLASFSRAGSYGTHSRWSPTARTVTEPQPEPERKADMSTKRQNGKTERTAPTTGAEDRSGAIARLAYQKWEARGCPNGDDLRDWLEAERDILATHTPESIGAVLVLAATANR